MGERAVTGEAPKPYQHPGEIAALIDYLASALEPPDSILEIGVWEGGTLAAFGDRFPGAVRVGVDQAPFPSAFDQGAEIIVGRSQHPDTQAKVRAIREQWDLVFIDGAHDEDSAMQDLEFAMTLSPRWIALHDITCRTSEALDCWKIWDQLVKYAPRLGRRTVEFKQDTDWWGIGLVEMPAWENCNGPGIYDALGNLIRRGGGDPLESPPR